MKRVWAVVLALVMLLSVLPMGAFAQSIRSMSGDDNDFDVSDGFTVVVESGDCGDNLTWTLYDNGTLVISGEGDMLDYSYDAPWSDLDVTTVIINQGVTSIGSCAFADCISLTSVIIPASVTSIGVSAFYDCSDLTISGYSDSYAESYAAENGLPFVVIGGQEPDEGDALPGDINGDGVVNNKDLGLLQRYINRWDVDIDVSVADVNDDGTINNKDLGLLQRYINRWDVELT